jgi:hypothetical protein
MHLLRMTDLKPAEAERELISDQGASSLRPRAIELETGNDSFEEPLGVFGYLIRFGKVRTVVTGRSKRANLNCR